MKKKWISILTTACLLTTPFGLAQGAEMMAMPVAQAEPAAASSAEGLTAAIERAKELLAIDSNIWDDFTYNSYESGEGLRWSLEWRQSADSEPYLSATIDENGIIYAYHYYQPTTNKEGLAGVRQTQAAQIADAFLAQVAGEYAQSLTRLPLDGGNQWNEAFNFSYEQRHEGIAVAEATVTVQVSRTSGVVTDFSVGSNINCGNLPWPAQSKVIAKDTASQAFLKNVGVELIYAASYDYQTSDYRVYPLYRLSQSDKAIDAVSGKVISLTELANARFKSMVNESAADTGAQAGGSNSLSAKELAAIEAHAKLISQEDAASKLRQAAGIGEDYALRSASLGTSAYEKNRYIWRISLEAADDRHLSGSVDAQSGQLLGFYHYTSRKMLDSYQEPNQTEKSTQRQSKTQADQAVAAWLKQYAPAELAASQAIADEDNTSANDDTDEFYYRYQRMVNGIPFPDNGIFVSYDRLTGQVVSYQLTWNQSVTFPSVQKAKTPSEIMQDMMREADYSLLYARDENGYRLIYDFADKSAMRFDPFNGTRLNWKGEVYTPGTLPTYHWQGAASESAQRLYENGIYLDKTQLNINETITQSELAQLLYRSRYPYATLKNGQSADTIYDELHRLGIINQNEATPDEAVTRQQAALYAMRYLGYGRLNAHPALFVYPYSDKADSDYQTSVAIAGALGLLSADETQAIRPTDNLSVGEAFDLIYQMLAQ